MKQIHVVAAVIVRETRHSEPQKCHSELQTRHSERSEESTKNVILNEREESLNQVFATQRGYGEFKDWWEFPGGKIESGETEEDALKREIREELATEISVNEKLGTVEYDYPTFHLTMECFLCGVVSGKLTLLEHENAKWLGASELKSVKWLPADEEILGKVAEKLKDD